MLNRRGFLSRLIGGALAASTMDLEELLWTRKKLISIPKPGPILFCGQEIIINPRALPGRIDFIDLRNWARMVYPDDSKTATISPGRLSADGNRMEFTLTPPPFRLAHISRKS